MIIIINEYDENPCGVYMIYFFVYLKMKSLLHI